MFWNLCISLNWRQFQSPENIQSNETEVLKELTETFSWLFPAAMGVAGAWLDTCLGISRTLTHNFEDRHSSVSTANRLNWTTGVRLSAGQDFLLRYMITTSGQRNSLLWAKAVVA
jgi:hypothetical protein